MAEMTIEEKREIMKSMSKKERASAVGALTLKEKLACLTGGEECPIELSPIERAFSLAGDHCHLTMCSLHHELTNSVQRYLLKSGQRC